MVIQTLNTRYTLEDRGDGAFVMSGNPKFFPTPTLVRALAAPVVGQIFWITYLEGPKVGRVLHTSNVVSIED